MSKDFNENALDYHRHPRPGKLATVATKPLATQRDLALAYTPGVAVVCEAIAQDEQKASELTLRSNLIGVITNGTAVLGLGNIGPLASKPVMEGKAVLFKKFAGLDVFDIELNENEPSKLVDIIASLEPTFGGINLEDIKAPECFEVETELKKRLNIPVFHDDQHGTAIIAAAAIENGLKLVDKSLSDMKLVCSGAGAAAIACLDLLVDLGLSKKNIIMCDRKGIVYEGRPNINNPYKEKYAAKTEARCLGSALQDADIFLGVSSADLLTPEMIQNMAPKPLILALANPVPEINPIVAKKARPDAIIATGRSDYPNQVNNVLCFPFIFRGALDVGATVINKEMKMACVHALASLAQAEPSDIVAKAYAGEDLQFGPDYIIPKPFDPRLIVKIAPAVARAAMDTGVATRPIEDFDAYRHKLTEFVFRSSLVMRPVFNAAKQSPKRLAYAEGEDQRVLQAIQVVVDEDLAQPVIIGRRDVVDYRIRKLGLRLKIDKDFELVDPQGDPRYKEYCETYHSLMQRRGVSPEFAKEVVRTNTTAIAALMVYREEADAMLAGPVGRFNRHLRYMMPILGKRPNVSTVASLTALITGSGTFFLCDPYVNEDPSAQEIAEMTVLAAEQVRCFGTSPKVALVSHANFGTNPSASAEKMQAARLIINKLAPDLEVEGEMRADTAINPAIRERLFPNSKLEGAANLLVMPNLDAANIAFNMVKAIADCQPVGPILLGLKQAGHILTPSATVRSIVNMSALAAVDAGRQTQQIFQFDRNKAVSM
ncbi:MAG: NADP-dependent malic enzyme [Pseudomonadota bacterium]